MKTDIPNAVWGLAEMGFRLLGCDTDAKIERHNRGEFHIKHIPGTKLGEIIKNNGGRSFFAATDIQGGQGHSYLAGVIRFGVWSKLATRHS
jgi:hypothetical protein